ncbi:NAD(P)H-hydrate dehydratase [Nocardioides sp. SYSU D00065]|uniref:NAD(P)H-hydrate dehydratase n=1 Tax=Nocardioides sp. SYSU D00065 TaxID=2817378 RepID=UPI001B31109E|nr:NAD(P)H-hydrate dehydratase [Nocardioides sp. SYSU D00065]
MPDSTLVDAALLADWPLPEPGSDKEERGRLVAVAGGRDTPGAALLAVDAAFRVGAGKVRLATARSCATALAVAAPELMVTGLAEHDSGIADPAQAARVLALAEGSSAVLMGSGFTDPEASAALVGAVVPHLGATVVLDAIASAYVTEDPERLATLDATFVLTVNPSELAHCLDLDQDEVESDLAGHAALLARRTSATVLCGGPVKVVAHGDDLWRVEAGNPGLGTAGSGDVQAGLVTGLLARGADPAQAAVWGAFLHGTAGDRLAERIGPVGYLARELAGEVPGLLAELSR